MFDLDARQKNIVTDILKHYVPMHQVWVFGSRTCGTARKTSDIDLVIIDDIKISDVVLIELKQAFDDSLLDVKVDVVFWSGLGQIFQSNIKNNYEIIQKSLFHNDNQ